MSRTLVIAECGSCHDASLRHARALIYAAQEAGADIAKFQFWSSSAVLAHRRHVDHADEAVYQRYQLPISWLPELKDLCDVCGLGFMATAYLPEDVEAVAPYVAHFKVASFEAKASDLLAAHEPFLETDREAGRERWLIISRGLGADHASGIAYRYLSAVKFLLCTSAYPAPVTELNLRRFHKQDADVLDGFSDHSPPDHTWTGALAVAAGATIVERHLRLETTAPENPDYGHSMVPRAFRDYVSHIRYTEAALGDGTRRARRCEEPLLKHRVGLTG